MDYDIPDELGDFRILGVIAQGPHGAVVKACQESLNRPVALKILPKRSDLKASTFGRFMREARAVVKLRHPFIVEGYDAGEADGFCYFAMEFVEGYNLYQQVCKSGPLKEKEAAWVGAAISSALHYIHCADIIHRDVKPENILLSKNGTPKLVDLGLAKGESLGKTQFTKEGTVVGTPHFMAPEQAMASAQIDGRTDEYSLGCTLYFALTGKLPFEGRNHAEVMVKHLKGRMPHPRRLRPDLSPDFTTILAHMVALNQRDRYASLQEVEQEIQALLAGKALRRKMPPEGHCNFAFS